MLRPSVIRAPRVARPPRAQAPAPARSATRPPDSRGSVITTLMVWVMIVYLVVPIQYFYGDMLRDSAVIGMASPNPLARTIKIGLLSLSAAVVLWKGRLALLEAKTVNIFFWVFMTLVPASVLWSVARDATINRYLSLWSITAVCLAFTLLGWNRSRFQDVVRPIVTALLVASIIFGLLYPQYAIEVGEGTLKNSWRGLADQKNQFGMLASFGAIFWLHAWLSKEKPWWMAILWLGLSFECLLLSRSSTAILATVLSTLFLWLLMVAPSNLRRLMPYVVGSFAVVVVVYALTVLNLFPGISILLTPITEMLGKDLTFSNRSQIWDIIKEHIALAPVLGSGYGAYWTGAVPSSPSYVFLGRMFFYPTQSHNGYLEIVNDLGFVGLFCLLFYLVIWVKQSLRLMRLDRGQGVLFLALFFQQAVTNLTESTWLAINSAFAIAVATLATFSMARSLLDRRLWGVARPSAVAGAAGSTPVSGAARPPGPIRGYGPTRGPGATPPSGTVRSPGTGVR